MKRYALVGFFGTLCSILAFVWGVIKFITTSPHAQKFLKENDALVLFLVMLFVGGIGVTSFFGLKVVKAYNTFVSTFGYRWKLVDHRLLIGNTINVALRAKTVQGMLNAFSQVQVAGKVLCEKEYHHVLKQAGKAIGEEFASELREELIERNQHIITNYEKTKKMIEKKLELWASYDSTTGIGQFDVKKVECENGEVKGYILIHNSFLSFDRFAYRSTRLCPFLEGYMEGVLLHVLNSPVLIEEVSCHTEKSQGFCKFKITTLKDKPSQQENDNA